MSRTSRPQVAGPMGWPVCAGSGARRGPACTGISPPSGPNHLGALARLGRCRMQRWSTAECV